MRERASAPRAVAVARFVLAVGSDGDAFQRRIVRISTRAVAQLLDKDARLVDADFERRDRKAQRRPSARRLIAGTTA
jgi:hypothetical protein